MKKIVVLLCAISTAVAVNVNAMSLSVLGGTADTLPNNWSDVNGALAPNIGDSVITFSTGQAALGEGIYLDGDATLKYEYLGKEAGNVNTASTTSFSDFFDTSVTSAGETYQEFGSAGALDFTFTTDGRYTTPGSFTNAIGGQSTFWLSVFVESNNSLILMFGDGFGDSDFDDMIVRVSAVPIPAAVWLFATAICGFFGMRMRKKAI
jgi:hypothetical protein